MVLLCLLGPTPHAPSRPGHPWDPKGGGGVLERVRLGVSRAPLDPPQAPACVGKEALEMPMVPAVSFPQRGRRRRRRPGNASWAALAPVFPAGAATHRPGTHTRTDPPSCRRGHLDVQCLPLQALFIFLGGGGGHRMTPARSSQRLRELAYGAPSAPFAFCLVLVGVGAAPQAPILPLRWLSGWHRCVSPTPQGPANVIGVMAPLCHKRGSDPPSARWPNGSLTNSLG